MRRTAEKANWQLHWAVHCTFFVDDSSSYKILLVGDNEDRLAFVSLSLETWQQLPDVGERDGVRHGVDHEIHVGIRRQTVLLQDHEFFNKYKQDQSSIQMEDQSRASTTGWN